MTLHRERKLVTVGDQHLTLYTSRLAAAKTPLPAVIVIQEIFGPDYHIQDVVDRFANAGYFAVAPDLFAENGERPALFSEERIEGFKTLMDRIPPALWGDREQLDKVLEQEPQELADTFRAVFGLLPRVGEFVVKLRATVQYLQDAEETKGQKIGTVGYCMGGALSAQMAIQEPGISGAVIYYGRTPQENVEQINCPVLGIFAEHDPGINPGLPGFEEALKNADKSFEIKVYEGAKHGFFNDTRGNYDVDAARDAWVKTLTFFNQVLV